MYRVRANKELDVPRSAILGCVLWVRAYEECVSAQHILRCVRLNETSIVLFLTEMHLQAELE